MLGYPNLSRLMLGGGVLLEIVSILMVFNRQAALALGIGMLHFHEIVDVVMFRQFRFNGSPS
ncbi:MAG: hypothetical protein O3C21_13820 [Verrucomicrobia bacterium]|nr:hypothetical protein [Verrucomicrobiota bacterium]